MGIAHYLYLIIVGLVVNFIWHKLKPKDNQSEDQPTSGGLRISFATYLLLFLSVMVINVLAYCYVLQQWELFKILACDPIFFITYVVFTTSIYCAITMQLVQLFYTDKPIEHKVTKFLLLVFIGAMTLGAQLAFLFSKTPIGM